MLLKWLPDLFESGIVVKNRTAELLNDTSIVPEYDYVTVHAVDFYNQSNGNDNETSCSVYSNTPDIGISGSEEVAPGACSPSLPSF